MQTPRTPDRQSEREIASTGARQGGSSFRATRMWLLAGLAAAGLLGVVKGSCDKGAEEKTEYSNVVTPSQIQGSPFAPTSEETSSGYNRPEMKAGSVSQEGFDVPDDFCVNTEPEPGETVLLFRNERPMTVRYMNEVDEVYKLLKDRGLGKKELEIINQNCRSNPCKGVWFVVDLPF